MKRFRVLVQVVGRIFQSEEMVYTTYDLTFSYDNDWMEPDIEEVLQQHFEELFRDTFNVNPHTVDSTIRILQEG